jgi:TRAP-type C4-dicarboxylate transport system permease small subunit
LRVLHRFEDALIGLLLVALIGLAATQIVARLVFHAGWPWLDPLSRVLVVWTALLGALAAVREDRHISLDVATMLLRGPVRRLARAATLLLAAATSAVMAWYGWRLVQIDQESGSMIFGNVPAWQAELCLPVVFGLMALRFFLRALVARPARAS